MSLWGQVRDERLQGELTEWACGESRAPVYVQVINPDEDGIAATERIEVREVSCQVLKRS